MGAENARGRLLLAAEPGSAGRARGLVREILAAADRADLADAAELVVSELVTNALLHAGTPLTLRVRADRDGVFVEVEDGSPYLPVERDYATLSGTGRGLAMVHQLSQGWGVRPTGAGKTVWARIATGFSDARIPDWSSHHVEVVGVDRDGGEPIASTAQRSALADHQVGGNRGAEESLWVQLKNMPLLMHMAWLEHAEALMREYLLARLEADELVALQQHAHVSQAMSLLHRQIPAPALPGGAHALGDVDELLTSVVEPVPTLASCWLEVPAESLMTFRVLNEVLDEAVAMADADLLLAAPIQPELRELRRWICAEVAAQSHGAEPTAWTPPTSAQPPGTFLEPTSWDSGPVHRSTRAIVAADDTNRIIAVSEPALALLCYDHAAQLLGRRLLVLIPRRFHQAHLAGFTMFLTTGRRPLIDTPVTVPFVRQDTSEIPLQITLHVLAITGGRRVFVAELASIG